MIYLGHASAIIIGAAFAGIVIFAAYARWRDWQGTWQASPQDLSPTTGARLCGSRSEHCYVFCRM